MSIQVAGPTTGAGVRSDHATAALTSGAGSINQGLGIFAHFVRALKEARRRESAQIVARYRHLIDRPSNQWRDVSVRARLGNFTSSRHPIE